MAHCRCWLTRSIFECSPKFGPFQLNTISLPVMTSFLSIWHTVFTVNAFSLFLETSKLLIGMAHPLYSKFKRVATKVKIRNGSVKFSPKIILPHIIHTTYNISNTYETFLKMWYLMTMRSYNEMWQSRPTKREKFCLLFFIQPAKNCRIEKPTARS